MEIGPLSGVVKISGAKNAALPCNGSYIIWLPRKYLI
jgi:UDP-N-acetylglucosamine enolpyruvyl transferase